MKQAFIAFLLLSTCATCAAPVMATAGCGVVDNGGTGAYCIPNSATGTCVPNYAFVKDLLWTCGPSPNDCYGPNSQFALLQVKKASLWYVSFPDGFATQWRVTGTGECVHINPPDSCCTIGDTYISCWPGFVCPMVGDGYITQTVAPGIWNSNIRTCCIYSQADYGHAGFASPTIKELPHTCTNSGGDCETTDLDFDGWDACEDCDDTYYDPYNQCNGTFCESCAFDEDCYECDLTSYCEVGRCWATTPILIDINGDGYQLTSAAGGVAFDMSGYGSRQALSWTAAGSDDAWLVLDRNGNGVVDNGKELFGSATPQAHTGNAPNGFNALAHYDRPLAGGNGDGVIDSRDAIFNSLRLWQDLNHNGISEPNELHTLPQLGVSRIDLDYKESRRTDQYGNRFRYRAKVYDLNGAHVGRFAWDVSLVPLR